MSAPVETPSALVLRAIREVVGSEHGHRVHCVGTGPDVTPTVAFTSSNGEMVSLDDVSAALFHLACQKVKSESEVTRLRAALSEIAALQTEEPEDDVDLFGISGDEGYEYGVQFGEEAGRFEAAEMARRGLGS